MRSHRLQLAVLLLAVVSLLAFGASAAFAATPGAPTDVTASASNAAASVGWHAPADHGDSAIDHYTVTTTGTNAPLPVTVNAPATNTTITGLTNTDGYTFTVTAHNASGDGTVSDPSASVTPTPAAACQFDSFPAVPGGSSELAVACTLTTGAGGLGNVYKIEDYPTINWHSGAGRSVTTTAATATTSKVITSSSGHFAAQDVNDTISGPGIPSNSFIVAVSTSAGTATLNQVVGSPGVASGAKLIVDNSDGRTLTDTVFPTTTVGSASNGADSTTLTTLNTATSGTAKFPPVGDLVVATSNGTANLHYTAKGTSSFTGVTNTGGTGTVATSASIADPTALYSTTAHFCKSGLTGCGTGATAKNDVGRTLSATRIPHGTAISLVNSSTSVSISAATVACPTGLAAASCAHVGISSLPGLTTLRQIKDATYTSGKVCSVTAGFGQTDVNLPIANVGTGRIPSGDYIASVSGTCATMHVAWTATTVNTNVVIGARSSSAPLNNDAVMGLSSELSVAPGEAAGEPSCDFNSAVGSNLVGKWENPGSFATTGVLGTPSAAVINRPLTAQLLVTTGAGNPAFAGYVMPVGASYPGDTDTAAHVDIIFPLLLNGIAVCPEPNDVGVATNFRFFGETLSQSAAGNGDVREFKDVPGLSGSIFGIAYEHVVKSPSTPIADGTSTTCTVTYPTATAGFGCGGQ